VESSGTRVKDIEFVTRVENIPIFNFGRMLEHISSVEYEDKTPQKTKLVILLGRFLLWRKIIHDVYYCYNCDVEQIGWFDLTFSHKRKLRMSDPVSYGLSPMEKISIYALK
jgi:hypothetical protein